MADVGGAPSVPSGSTPDTQRRTARAVTSGVVATATSARMRSDSATSTPTASAWARRRGETAAQITLAWPAVIAPAANAWATAGSAPSRRAVDTTAAASPGERWQLPRSHAFIDTAPSAACA